MKLHIKIDKKIIELDNVENEKQKISRKNIDIDEIVVSNKESLSKKNQIFYWLPKKLNLYAYFFQK